MANSPLTLKQKQILDHITHSIDNGGPPTLSEIAAHFKLGITTIQDHVSALVAKGALKRKNKARGLLVAGRPQTSTQLRLPILGRIRAGSPTEALEHAEDYVNVDKSLAYGADYLLRVRGDSMEPLIFEDDLVFVKKIAIAEPGDCVIAHVDEDEATVKRLRCKAGEFWLEAVNPRYRPIRGRPFKIVGKVLGLMRTYARPRA